ncbi:MAG: hypothetical protein R3A52_27025, partial [Polyangiales bacterium]
DDAAVKTATEKLEAEMHRVASQLYQATGEGGEQGGPQGQPGASTSTSGNDEGVIDAEFEENK